MAIYHLNARVGSRSSGQSAAAKFAYICREGRYADGKTTRVDKEELVHAESRNMPAWAEKNPALYWQSADLYERANGRLFQQVEIALPVELSGEEQIQLAQKFALALSATEAGPLPYSFAVHRGKGENPHAHIIVSERVCDGYDRTPETWFKRAADTKKQTPELGGAKKSAAFQPREWLGEVREPWATCKGQVTSIRREGWLSICVKFGGLIVQVLL
jgi:MobA/MobL family protein